MTVAAVTLADAQLGVSIDRSLCVVMLLAVVSFGFVWGCGALASYLDCSLVLVHWIYLIVAFVVLAVGYVVFKKKYYWMHEEYLASIKK